MAFIISADEIKKTLLGYSPSKSELFHRTSAKLADKAYEKALKERPEKTVILMSGGTASGKSEYVSAYLAKRSVIVLDGTLPSFEGAKIKIKKAQKAGKKIEIHLVMPNNLLVAFIAFLNRERKFSPEHFYRTHSNSRRTVLDVAQSFSDILIRIFISDVDFIGSEQTMSFKELKPRDQHNLIEFMKRNQYNEEDIKKIVFNL